MQAGDQAVLELDAWFGGLPAAHRTLLLSAGRTVSLAEGALVYATGDAPNGLWAVLSGEVRLKSYPAPGLEVLALNLAPGEWFGELSIIDGEPRPQDAIAHGPTRLYHIPISALARLTAETPLLFRDLGRLACRHERMALDFISQLLFQPRQRVARLLLARTSPEGPELRLRQEDMAGMLVLSRQTLNRHLKEFAVLGAIALSYGSLRILSRVGLERIA